MDPAIVTELGNNITNSFQITMNKISPIWLELGIAEDDQVRRCKTAQDHLLAEMENIAQSEEIAYEEFLADINKKTSELVELATALSLEPIVVDDSLSLLEKNSHLSARLNELMQEKENRMVFMKQLKKTESKYCTMLGMATHVMTSQTEVPSEADLRDLEEHVHMLMEKRNRLHLKYCSVKSELVGIMQKVEMTPDTDFERHALNCEDDEFLLSEENMNELNAFLTRARAKKLELENQKETLVDKTTKLWDRLAISVDFRQAFLENHNDYRVSTLKGIQREIERCEAIKRENMKSYIEVLQVELRELWVKCHISESEQGQFWAQIDDQMSEDNLNKYEVEVQRVNQYYKNTEKIFEKIEKRRELWDAMINFENKAKDPQKYLNRGGNLLREEKERKKLNRDLPSIEKEIFKAINDYETFSGKKFLYIGMDFETFVSDQWEQHRNEKESETLFRQKLHVTLREQTTINKRLSLALTPSKVMIWNSRMSTSGMSDINRHAADIMAASIFSSSKKNVKNSDYINSSNSSKGPVKNTAACNDSSSSKNRVKISDESSSSSKKQVKTDDTFSVAAPLKIQLKVGDTFCSSNSSKSQSKVSEATNGPSSFKGQISTSGAKLSLRGVTNGPCSSKSCKPSQTTSARTLRKGLRSSPNAALHSGFADDLGNHPRCSSPKKSRRGIIAPSSRTKPMEKEKVNLTYDVGNQD